MIPFGESIMYDLFRRNKIFFYFIIFTMSLLKTCKFYIGFGGTDDARILINEPLKN